MATKKKQSEVVTPFPEPPQNDETESVFTQRDINKLMEHSFFLQALVDLMHTASKRSPDDRDGSIECSQVADLLQPISEGFHEFVFNDLEQRDWWKASDRMQAMELLYSAKKGGAA